MLIELKMEFGLRIFLFTSPYVAAGFVTYASANGIIMWLDKEGRTLKEIENNED